MSITLHILKQSGRLVPYTRTITDAFDDAVVKITSIIPLPNIDVVVADNADAAIPETGVGGFAPTSHLLYINVNPAFEKLSETIGFEIQSTLAHELHHCARWEAVGYGSTLLEALISEGLADHFDMEINGGAPRPWSAAIPEEQLKQLRERASQEFTNDTYDHQVWFFGSEKENIPRWAGYSLGFQIVSEYLAKKSCKASDLVGTRAEEFV